MRNSADPLDSLDDLAAMLETARGMGQAHRRLLAQAFAACGGAEGAALLDDGAEPPAIAPPELDAPPPGPWLALDLAAAHQDGMAAFLDLLAAMADRDEVRQEAARLAQASRAEARGLRERRDQHPRPPLPGEAGGWGC